MKKITLLLVLLISTSFYAQSYLGYLADNYSGINSVIHNPANIVDSRFKTDIHLVGASFMVGNDYIATGLSDIDTFDNFDETVHKTPKDDNNIFLNLDVMGPAFMFNIAPKHAIGVFTRGRAMYNVNKINGKTYENIDDGFDENEDFNINEDDFYLTATAWAEIGVSYAAVLMDQQEHFLKGGISLKYLHGLARKQCYYRL